MWAMRWTAGGLHISDVLLALIFPLGSAKEVGLPAGWAAPQHVGAAGQTPGAGRACRKEEGRGVGLRGGT